MNLINCPTRLYRWWRGSALKGNQSNDTKSESLTAEIIRLLSISSLWEASAYWSDKKWKIGKGVTSLGQVTRVAYGAVTIGCLQRTSKNNGEVNRCRVKQPICIPRSPKSCALFRPTLLETEDISYCNSWVRCSKMFLLLVLSHLRINYLIKLL